MANSEDYTGALVLTNARGEHEIIYRPQAKQALFHASSLPNLIMEGRRGTGKSLAIRMDAHMRALSVPNYTYLILRRTMPELRRSHLLFINREMEKFGGAYLKGVSEAHYANGSIGLYSHCETDADIEKFLSSQFSAIYFDEITTFPFEMFTKISTSCRVSSDSGLTAIVRGGTNPLGVSAEEVYHYFIARDVSPIEDPDYLPSEWGSIKLNREDNSYIDTEQYDKRFAGLSAAYRAAWLEGVWGVEGAYFDVRDEHLLKEMPQIEYDGIRQPVHHFPWVNIYRVLDWGFHPDPAVCVWIAVLPNGRAIPFMEQAWTRTTAQEVARQIKDVSDGMHVVATFADPSIWDGERDMGHSIADEFETRGIPLTRAVNDRVAAGRAIQEHLNQMLADGLPRLQILEYGTQGCPDLVRSLRAMRIDKKREGRIADHRHDHHTICLAYFCMAAPPPSQPPRNSSIPRWMQRQVTRRTLGAGGVRHAIGTR